MRKPDGLALSSRNAYLSEDERKIAPKLHATLREAALVSADRTNPWTHSCVPGGPSGTRAFGSTMCELRNAATLAPVVDHGVEPMRILAAAWLGRTRLIDNVAV